MTDDLQHTRTELILCIFLGWLGAHRFYARKYGTAIIYLLTMGVFCIGWIRDIIVLARRYFSLKKGGSTVEVVVSEEAISSGRRSRDACEHGRKRAI
ncbi:MAG: TM2 domain-containing protein [Adlercreutzia equolifaciens]